MKRGGKVHCDLVASAVNEIIDQSDHSGSADDVSKRYRNQISHKPRPAKSVKGRNNGSEGEVFEEQPGRNEIHVCDRVFESARDECGDWKKDGEDFIADISTGAIAPQVLRDLVTLLGLR